MVALTKVIHAMSSMRCITERSWPVVDSGHH